MESLSNEERQLVEQTVQFLGREEDDNFKWTILKIGGDETEELKKLADRFKPGPGENIEYAGLIKMLLDLPAENIMISVPKDTTKSDVMEKWVRFKDTGLSGSELYGRLKVMAMARCGEKQAEKCKRCKEDGSRPFEGCLTVPGHKDKGCVACMKLFYENGKDEKYDCSFETEQ